MKVYVYMCISCLYNFSLVLLLFLLLSLTSILSVQVLCPSPKQYYIGSFPPSAPFPCYDDEDITMSKKAKGVQRRTIAKELKRNDFHSTLKGVKCRSVPQFTLKRSRFRIFMIESQKRMLTKFNAKRLFIDSVATDLCLFSFPLHFKKFVVDGALKLP